MKKKRTEKLVCSSCNNKRYFSELKQSIKIFKLIFKTSDEVMIKRWFQSNIFEWACDHCIQTGKAILRDPYKVYGNENDAVSFWDQNLRCKSCNSTFLFSKEEKKYWFEELKFYPLSKPKQCSSCRKEIRIKKDDNTRLSEILKNGEDKLDKKQLQEIVEIYTRLGKDEKMKKFQNKLKKLNL